MLIQSPQRGSLTLLGASLLLDIDNGELFGNWSPLRFDKCNSFSSKGVIMTKSAQISMCRGFLTIGFVVILILATSWGGICGNSGPPPKNPRVISPKSPMYGELAGKWWNWAMQFPSNANPLIDPDGTNCDLGQKGNIWFLAGTWSDDTERDCTVPPGMAIFFPIINSNSWHPEWPEEGDPCNNLSSPEERVRCDVNADIDLVNDLACEIDGVSLQDLFSYRAESPEGGYTLSIPEGSILTDDGLLPGDRYPAVADGYWILLPALPKGEHVIHFYGKVEVGEGEFVQDMTYNLTVGD